ncbi:MAG: TonB-dependent receptor [Prevotellaceae bacterium]|jgi:outer membrane receptor for ferrienterochelin and colicin|nr:TonB-dependent receptor [Prevotellaceae bacterium]
MKIKYLILIILFPINIFAQTETDTTKIQEETLNEVTVSTQIKTMNMRSTVLNVQQLGKGELLRAACCNLSESFETNASVDVSYSDAATGAKQIKLLGLSGTYVQMLTENIPNLKGLAAPYGLGYIPGPWMESIQISKGTGSVINGYESVTGQINVEYKKPTTADKLSLNLYANESGRLEFNADAAFKLDSNVSTGILLHASDETLSKFPQLNDRNKDNFMDMPMVRQFNGINRWYFTKGNYMGQVFLHGLYEKRMGGQIEAENPYKIDIETQRYEFFVKNGYIINTEKEQSIGLILSGNFHKQGAMYGRNNYSGKQLNFYSNLIFQTKLAHDHKLSTGWSTNFDKIDENVQAIAGQASNDINHKKEFTTGIFAEYTYNLHEKLIVLAGLRGDYNTYFKKILTTPRLHIKYMPIEQINLRATVGKGYRTANILAENNYLLASSRSWKFSFVNAQKYFLESAWNGGLSAQFFIPIKNRELQIMVEYFYTQFQNQAVIDLDKSAHEVNIYALNSPPAPLNGGKSYAHNFQVEATMEAFKGFTFTAAYRLTDAKQTIDGKLREKPFTSRWKGLLTMSYATRLNKWQFDYTLQANGGGRLADPDAQNPLWDKEFKPYLIMNAQVTKNFKKWSIYLGAENFLNFVQKNPIIDVQNPFSNDFDATMVWGPTHGRNIYAGFRFRL